MSPNTLKPAIHSAGRVAWNLFLITAGSLLCAFSINGIVVPHHFLSGGFSGISLVIHYLEPRLTLQVIYFLLNIPVFALGWMFVGRRFFIYSIAGMVIYSLALALKLPPFPELDMLSSAVLAGIISGAGTGIILKSLGSGGGLDILGVIFYKKFSVRIGSTILAFNAVILTAGALLFSLEAALYSLIYMFVTSRIIDIVVTGLSQRKFVFIVSPRWQEISQGIIHRINRGVTLVKGQGGYTGREEQIIYTVINFREVSQLKELIRQVDPQAFVVVTDTLEVMGHRIGNQPHW